MEQNTNEGSTQTGEVQGNNAEKLNAADLLKEIEALKATNSRLLDESKGHKEAKQKAAEELRKQEEKIAQEKGDLAKLLEMRSGELTTYKTKAQQLEERLMMQEVRSAVSQFASDAIDLEDVLNQPTFAGMLPEIADRETLTVNKDKAKQYVEELRKVKTHLFKASSQPGVVTKKPGVAPTTLNAGAMTQEQIIEALKALK